MALVAHAMSAVTAASAGGASGDALLELPQAARQARAYASDRRGVMGQ